MLAQHHALTVSRETLRKWMTGSGIWLSRKQRRSFHQPRLRREAFGELIQIDGSEHHWFEDRGDACTLLVFIDDATGQLMQLRFVSSESTASYFDALWSYLETHGCPAAFYSDKHTVFRIAKPDAKGGQGMTQFGRALAELNIEIICANSSQAKGRVERVNRTLQDRLVKRTPHRGRDRHGRRQRLPGRVHRALQRSLRCGSCPPGRSAPTPECPAVAAARHPVPSGTALREQPADASESCWSAMRSARAQSGSMSTSTISPTIGWRFAGRAYPCPMSSSTRSV
jgi:hypothetical protein